MVGLRLRVLFVCTRGNHFCASVTVTLLGVTIVVGHDTRILLQVTGETADPPFVKTCKEVAKGFFVCF